MLVCAQYTCNVETRAGTYRCVMVACQGRLLHLDDCYCHQYHCHAHQATSAITKLLGMPLEPRGAHWRLLPTPVLFLPLPVVGDSVPGEKGRNSVSIDWLWSRLINGCSFKCLPQLFIDTVADNYYTLLNIMLGRVVQLWNPLHHLG